MANALMSHIGAFVDTVARTHWDGTSIIVYVCPLCAYWPINGEETTFNTCKRCKLKVDLTEHFDVGVGQVGELHRRSFNEQWLTKARITPTEKV